MSALFQNIRELILLILTQLYFLSCTKKSDSDVYYKPEGGDSNNCAIRVNPGKDIYTKVDGVATSKYSDNVLKIPDGSRITITPDEGGNIDWYGFGGLVRMHTKYGWIKKDVITKDTPKDTSWDSLFNKAKEIGKRKY